MYVTIKLYTFPNLRGRMLIIFWNTRIFGISLLYSLFTLLHIKSKIIKHEIKTSDANYILYICIKQNKKGKKRNNIYRIFMYIYLHQSKIWICQIRIYITYWALVLIKNKYSFFKEKIIYYFSVSLFYPLKAINVFYYYNKHSTFLLQLNILHLSN